MSSTLTCWKEIARHLGKGVRTVQRWEQELGLPVRRPRGKGGKSVILAFSDEIDAWMRSQFEGTGNSELEGLRRELATLRKQNEVLRARLERAEQAPTFVPLNEPVDLEQWMEEWLWKRCSRAIEKSSALRLRSAEIIDFSRNMKELRRIQREQNLRPSYDLLIQ